MIDLIIILLYIAVVTKILLKGFEWLENRFNIFGKSQTVNEAVPSTEPLSNQSKVADSSSVPLQSEVQKPKIPQGLIQQQLKIKQNTTEEKIEKISQQKQEQVAPAKQNKKEPVEESIPAPLEKQQLKPQEQQQVEAKSVSQTKIEKLELTNNQPSQKVVQINSQVQKPSALSQQQKSDISVLLKKISDLEAQKGSLAQKLQYQIKQNQSLQENKWKHNSQVEQLKINHEKQIAEVKATAQYEIQKLTQQLLESNESTSKLQTESQNENAKSEHRIESTVSEIVQSSAITSPNVNSAIQQATESLQSKIQQLKAELQFSQHQIQQLLESEKKLKQEVQQLSSTSNSRMKPRPVSITDVVNHSEYLRIKEKLQKYESGSGNSVVRSAIRAEFTPQGDRVGKTMDSRISERRSFISSKITDTANDKSDHPEEVFGECTFLNPEGKQFLLDEIKKIKKLPIKKTKLIFKLDKLHTSNPHEFIDNIPNIVMLIELTNKKVLAGFTQIAFSKDQLHIDKSSAVRSRFGSNKALILDLTNKVSFVNNHNSDTIIYDQNAIVWGKDELIIKNDEPTILYSTFGSQEGIYWDGKHSLEDLLGGSQGFERIEHYEFYRIYIG